MPAAAENDLRFLSELQVTRVRDLKAGASLVARTGFQVDDLAAKVALDRLALGAALHREARAAMKRNPASYRNAISRGYYAMYQTFRGIVFLVSGGDDHEKHSDLPGHLPKDFPGVSYWENALKTARLERNRADYEPYPRKDAHFQARAIAVLNDSQQLRTVARTYLRGKGLKI